MKERKILSATLQWLWKFGKNESEETSEEAAASEDGKAFCSQNGQNNVADSIADGCDTSSAETVDHNFMVSFRNLGLTMLGNIQVLISLNLVPLMLNQSIVTKCHQVILYLPNSDLYI